MSSERERKQSVRRAPLRAVAWSVLGPILVACSGNATSEDPNGRPFDTLIRIDRDTGSEVLGIRVGHRATPLGSASGFALAPDGSRLWLGVDGAREIVSADGSRTPLRADDGAVWSPDSQHLAFFRDHRPFIAGADGTAAQAVPTEGVLDADTVPVASWSAWSADSSHAAFELLVDPANDLSTVLLTDTLGASVTPVNSVVLLNWSGNVVFSPDGEHAAMATKQGVAVMRTDGQSSTTVPGLARPAWSAGGDWVLAGNQIVAPDGTGAVDVASRGILQGATWSPATNTLAFLDLAGLHFWSSAEGARSAGISSVVDLTWSPDGARLAYQGLSNDQLDWVSVVIDPSDGKELARFPSSSTTLRCFSWNSTGSRFADVTSEGELKTANADSGDVVTLARNVLVAAWLRDGEHLIYAVEGRVDLVRADGTGRVAVWSGKGEAVFPGMIR